MILKLLRFDGELSIGPEKVTTLEIENRHVFSRVASSLISERGEEAVEPYAIWDDAGKKKTAKGAFLVLSSLPELPLNDRTLLSKLYAKLAGSIRDDIELSDKIAGTTAELKNYFLDENIELWGQYEFGSTWDVAQVLKSFSFRPAADDDQTLLERMVNLFGLCADVNLGKPILLINAKSFFEPEELSEVASQAFFYGCPLMMLESWTDDSTHDWEQKTCIDQWFFEK